LAVPAGTKELKIKRIVFATDYSKVQDPSTLRILVDLAQLFNAEIHILNVNPIPSSTSIEEAEEAFSIEQYFKNVKHSFQFSSEGNIEKGINNYIKSNDIDMVAMIPQKHNLVKKLFKGSLTQKMAHHTKIPLLAFHQ